MAASTSSDLTTGPVREHLVRLTVPMIWGLAAMMGVHLVDTWFVSRLGPEALAAMGFTFPVVMTGSALGIGLMAGTSSVIARRIGRGDRATARRLASDALVLAALLAVVLAAAGLATIEPLFRLLGADERTLAPIGDYMRIWYLGLVVMLPPMAAVGAIRATGDSSGQSLVLVSASLVNAVLDPLLIFGLAGLPRLELEGAAIASVLARVASLGVGLWLLHARHRLLDLRPPAAAEALASCRAVLHVGVPAAGTNVIIPLANGVVTALVARHGAEAVAGYGAAFRIESMALIVFYALSAIVGPLVGQNLGAGRPARSAEAVAASARFCLALGLALAVLLALAAPALAALFSDAPGVRRATEQYLWLAPIGFGAAGVTMVVNAAFNGAGRPLAATAVSLTRILALYLPLAWLGNALAGPPGLFAGLALANLGGGAVAWAAWRRRLPRLEHTAGAPQEAAA